MDGLQRIKLGFVVWVLAILLAIACAVSWRAVDPVSFVKAQGTPEVEQWQPSTNTTSR